MATYRVYWTGRGFRVQGQTPSGSDASSLIPSVDELVSLLESAAGLELGQHLGEVALIAHCADDRFVLTGPCFIGIYLGLAQRPERVQAEVPLVAQRRARRREPADPAQIAEPGGESGS